MGGIDGASPNGADPMSSTVTPRCDVCLQPLTGLAPSVWRHEKCASAYDLDFTNYNARAVRLGIPTEHDTVYAAGAERLRCPLPKAWS